MGRVPPTPAIRDRLRVTAPVEAVEASRIPTTHAPPDTTASEFAGALQLPFPEAKQPPPEDPGVATADVTAEQDGSGIGMAGSET